MGDLGKNDTAMLTIPNVGRVTYISGPHFVCADGVQIWADSAVAYEGRAMTHLIGSVLYVDSTRELRADEARYFSDLGRIQAEGNVSVRDEARGSSIENGDLVLLRQTDFRAEETMTVTTGADGIRPRATLAPARDSSDLNADPGTPYTVVGDRIVLRGSSYFTSVGDVEIVRDSLFAFADSVEYDQSLGYLMLEGSARVESESYNLWGRTIRIGLPGAETSQVHALRDARLTGGDLVLTSAQIIVFLRDNAFERLVATRLGDGVQFADSADLVRPEARVQSFVLTADSLEVEAPNQTVRRIFAAGSARSASTSRDSLNVDLLPDIALSDWLEGDTVIVTFRMNDAATSPYSAADDDANGGRDGLDVETIVARGNASTLYRLTPSDTTAIAGIDPPAVHYVVGDEITIRMEAGEVHGMEVIGRTRGVHLEPLSRPAPADSAVAARGTSAVADSTSTIDTVTIARARSKLDPVGHRPKSPNTHEPPAKSGAAREVDPWILP